jgi:hypothetical protein
VGLPPDLARLGDQLVDAARRTNRARRARRRRFAVATVTGAIAFAALTPGALEPAHRDLTIAAVAADGFARPGCDHARGARFTLVACEGPAVLHRPYAIQ